MTDAVVVGAGPNGLVAANVLADAGWSVVVVEAAEQPGGAVRSAEVTAPGFCNDLFSAFYPLAAASPIMAGVGPGPGGFEWGDAPPPVARPPRGGRGGAPSPDVDGAGAAPPGLPPGGRPAWGGALAPF